MGNLETIEARNTNAPPVVDAILTSEDVARQLGVSAQSVWGYRKSGILKPDFFVPGGARFRQSEVERFKAEQTALATASKDA